MGRRTRSFSPGTVFHLVSRTHRREPLFIPELRSEIARLIGWSVARTDAKLLAYAVMPNHIHVILRQGRGELATVMQPLLRRVAHRVQQHHGFVGGVVERRFRDTPCHSPDHVRSAVVYTHLNPWRAGLCGHDLSYRWTSHGAYLPGADPGRFAIDPCLQRGVLELFAGDHSQSRDTLCHHYLQWVGSQMARDRAARGETCGESTPIAARRLPACIEQAAWRRHFLPSGTTDPTLQQDLLPDLRDFVLAQLPRLAPGCAIQDLRGSRLPRRNSRYRRRVIRSATDRGFRTGDVASYFDVTPATVSKIRHASEASRAGSPGRPGKEKGKRGP